jgi:DNA-binding transcriptional regulator YiaG
MAGDELALHFVLRAQRLLNVNCRELARIAGVKPHAVRNWRTGAYKPNGDATLRIVNALLERNLGQG